MGDVQQSKTETIVTYALGAFVVAIIAWATLAFLRSEGMLDVRLGVAFAVVAIWGVIRRIRKR